jgi:hypothetical protein
MAEISIAFDQLPATVWETLNKWLRGRIAAKRGVGFGRPLSRP